MNIILRRIFLQREFEINESLDLVKDSIPAIAIILMLKNKS